MLSPKYLLAALLFSTAAGNQSLLRKKHADGSDYVDPATGGSDYHDPAAGGSDYHDPAAGGTGSDYHDPAAGGSDYHDPAAGTHDHSDVAYSLVARHE